MPQDRNADTSPSDETETPSGAGSAGKNYNLDAAIEMLAELESAAAAADAAARVAAAAKTAAVEKVAETRKDIFTMLKDSGVLSDETALAKVSIAKTPEALVVFNEEEIPEEFYDMTPTRNNKRIKARIQSGIPVPGAEVRSHESLRVDWKKT